MWSGVSLRERLSGIHLRRISTSVIIKLHSIKWGSPFLVAYVTYTKRAERLLNYHFFLGDTILTYN